MNRRTAEETPSTFATPLRAPASGIGSVAHRERRSSDRAAVGLAVVERTGDAIYFQRATNLSLGGVFLDGTLPHPPGTRITLDVRLPGDALPVEVEGEVVEPTPHRPEGMGVRFVRMTDDDRGRLARFLAQPPVRLQRWGSRTPVAAE